MPDIGGFGRGLLKGALSATEKAAEKVKDAAEAAGRKVASDDDAETTQVISNATTQAADDDPDATQVVSSSITGTARQGPGRPGPMPGGPVPFGHPGSGPTAPPRPGWPGGPTPPSGLPIQGLPAQSGASQMPGTPPAGPNAGYATPPGPPPMPSHTRPASEAFVRPGQGPTTPPGGHHAPTGPLTPPGGNAAPVAPPGGAQFADPAGEPSLADEPEDHADENDVRELVEMFQELMAKRRPPAGPIQGEWSIGIGDLLGEHPKVPKRVRGIVSRLNRFGGLSYSPQEIVFDGDDVPWEKVTEVRTRHVVDYLIGDAVQQQVENLPLPWFPGRKRLLDALGQAILTVTIATAKNQLEKFELDLRVPAEIEYKASFGRKKELNAGVLSALVLADPAVNASVLATARARGITVVAGGDELLANAEERAAKIREKVAALEAELDKFTTRFGRKS